VHNPEKKPEEIDKILEAYRGKEEVLVEKLEAKYGVKIGAKEEGDAAVAVGDGSVDTDSEAEDGGSGTGDADKATPLPDLHPALSSAGTVTETSAAASTAGKRSMRSRASLFAFYKVWYIYEYMSVYLYSVTPLLCSVYRVSTIRIMDCGVRSECIVLCTMRITNYEST